MKGVKKGLAIFVLCMLSIKLSAQVSPWGTGTINSQTLGQLSGQSVYLSHTNNVVNYTFDLNNYLANYTYNLYIPPSYDGTEPYGVVTYINSGNSGTFSSSWISVLDEKKLIMVAGNNIGNSIAVVTRIGVAFAGSELLKETLNIDTNRVYASGNSGGARSCGSLMFFFPEKYTGMLSNCGSSYLRQVDQDYETYQLNSHYEYGIFPFNQAHLDYVNSFDRKYSMLTSFDDFREGDIMNIYHNGMEPDGMKSKILETTGGHCSTTTQHFRDAVNFVEHPHIQVVVDSFASAPLIGDGFKLDHASIANEQLVLSTDSVTVARAYSNNPFLWNDDKGAILRTSIQLDSTTFNENSYFKLGLLDYMDGSVYNEQIGHELYAGKPNLMLSLMFDGTQPTAYVLAENPSGGNSSDTLFEAVMMDWKVNEPLAIKYHLWNHELRIELDKHFDPGSVTGGAMTKLLDDNRSIRIRTDLSYWTATDFEKGALLTYAAGKVDSTLTSSDVKVNFLEVIAAEVPTCNASITENAGVDVINTCSTSFTWIDGKTYTENNYTSVFNIDNGGADGCDSLVVLNLSLNTSTTGVDDIETCNAYTWIDGNTYTESNNSATYTVTTAQGCDSIVSLNLTINNQTGGVDQITACEPIVWIDGNTYYQSTNIPTDTLQGINGCDSIVQLEFNLIEPELGLMFDSVSLTSLASGSGVTYQWLDCLDNFTELEGDTNQTYYPEVTGEYALEVNDNGCVDTTWFCVPITITNVTNGLESNSLKWNVVGYPNPTEGEFHVDLGDTYQDVSIIITDVSGKIILKQYVKEAKQIYLMVGDFRSGVYFVKVSSDTINTTLSLLKN